MLRTPLYERHQALGARLAEFAGWEMPIHYPAGILAEHAQCRERAALFDICHMGEFLVRGRGAAAALDALLPRSSSAQPVGRCRYQFLVRADGGVLDDLLSYRLAAEEFMLVVNAGTASADFAILRERLPGHLELRDLRPELGKLDLQGPESFQVLAGLGVPAAALPAPYGWARLPLGGETVLLSCTGYTGERGVELYLPRDRVGAFWDRLLEQPGVCPAGLGARDTLRLEKGYPLYGHELDETTTPVEAGFGALVPAEWAARWRRPHKWRVGFRLAGRRAARAGMAVRRPGDPVACGVVTSGAFAPSLGTAVAMGYVVGEAPPSNGARFEFGEPGGALVGAVAAWPFQPGPLGAVG